MKPQFDLAACACGDPGPHSHLIPWSADDLECELCRREKPCDCPASGPCRCSCGLCTAPVVYPDGSTEEWKDFTARVAERYGW